MEEALGMKLLKGHLDVEYSPSKWSQRMCPCEVLQEHMEFTSIESERIRTELPCQIGVAYGKTEAEKLDIIGTDLPDDAPICIFVHGGFWQRMGKEQSAYPAEAIHKMGIKFFVVGYALCPQVSLLTITEQIFRAYRFILDYAQENGSRSIHFLGHSAGAHLVVTLLGQGIINQEHKLLTAEIVKNVILVSGLYDLRPLLRSQNNEALQLSLDDAVTLSPLLWSGTPTGVGPEQRDLAKYKSLKMFVVVAEYDSPCFRAQSEHFFRKLKDFELNVSYEDIKGLDHFDIMHTIISKESSNRYSFAKKLKEMLQA